jgi:hypothetical protein
MNIFMANRKSKVKTAAFLPLQPDLVIPSEARDLHFAANCGSFASLGMTTLEELNASTLLAYRVCQSRNHAPSTSAPISFSTALQRSHTVG